MIIRDMKNDYFQGENKSQLPHDDVIIVNATQAHHTNILNSQRSTLFTVCVLY